MRTVRAAGELELEPTRALAVWADPERWPAFVEGFERVRELDPRWPAVGATVVWESIPAGRGRVSERVVEYAPSERFVTEVSERPLGGGSPRLEGRQYLALHLGDAGSEASARAELRLEYVLAEGAGVPGRITDLLFVRRSLRDALVRTLDRFAAEVATEDER
jgi:hypothetical protein